MGNMSRAFVKEDDFTERAPLRPLPTLPPGAKNYITREGADSLRAEAARLETERTRVAAAKDRARAADFDQRIARLEQILASVTVVEPAVVTDVVRFGASVTVKYLSGDAETFKIVGVNEIDLQRNYISWQSPLAKALLNGKAGETVTFKAPAGVQKLEILRIEYK
jgi:transcription elongation factor GreB